MTHPQHTPTEPARPVSEAERRVARRQREIAETSRRVWWEHEAPEHLLEALRENLDADTSRRIVEAARERDWEAVGAILWAAVEPYLDDQCVKAHDPEA